MQTGSIGVSSAPAPNRDNKGDETGDAVSRQTGDDETSLVETAEFGQTAIGVHLNGPVLN